MTPSTAQRLFTELTNAELAYRLSGVTIAEFCRRQANGHLGETCRELFKLSVIGNDANVFVVFFMKEFEG